MISPMGYPGRVSKKERVPAIFYVPYGTAYKDVAGIIDEKREISRNINAILTAHSPAGYHAERLFEEAFVSLKFRILKREASEFREKKVRGVPGKELPNLDFIIERDEILYGVDVKNWIQYERQTRFKVIEKVSLALQLEIVPFIIARYVDKDTIFTEIIAKGGICYPYQMLMIPSDYESLAKKAAAVLGYPVLAVDTLPRYKVDFIEKLHKLFCMKNS
jgi:hypothetical protein